MFKCGLSLTTSYNNHVMDRRPTVVLKSRCARLLGSLFGKIRQALKRALLLTTGCGCNINVSEMVGGPINKTLKIALGICSIAHPKNRDFYTQFPICMCLSLFGCITIGMYCVGYKCLS